MALPIVSVPVLAYVALVTDTTGVEVVDKGYARCAAEFDYCADHTTVANATTVQFPMATDQWGVISWVEVWDSPVDGVLFGTFPTLAPLLVDRYDIARIPAGGIAMVTGSAPRGFGTGGFGTWRYGTTLLRTLIGSSGGVPLEITFDRTQHVCAPGTWTTDPIFQKAA